MPRLRSALTSPKRFPDCAPTSAHCVCSSKPRAMLLTYQQPGARELALLEYGRIDCAATNLDQCICESGGDLNCEGSWKPDEGPAQCIAEHGTFDACETP